MTVTVTMRRPTSVTGSSSITVTDHEVDHDDGTNTHSLAYSLLTMDGHRHSQRKIDLFC